MPVHERTWNDLCEIVETQTKIAGQSDTLAEPASLQGARRQVEASGQQLRGLEAQLASAREALEKIKPVSGWQRFFGRTGDKERDTLQRRLQTFERKVQVASKGHNSFRLALQKEEQRFRGLKSERAAAVASEKPAAERRLAIACTAQKLMQRNGRLASWGAGHLMHLATKVQSQLEQYGLSDLPPEWDLVPRYDLWGIPYLSPAPKF